MKAFQNVLEAIGNTPLIKLGKISSQISSTIFGKAEHMNPGGSVKDRIGVAIIENAEQSGRLKPGGTIIEATGGHRRGSGYCRCRKRVSINLHDARQDEPGKSPNAQVLWSPCDHHSLRCPA